VDAPVVPAPLPLTQDVFLDLAGRRLGQVAERNRSRALEMGEVGATEGDDLGLCRLRARLSSASVKTTNSFQFGNCAVTTSPLRTPSVRSCRISATACSRPTKLETGAGRLPRRAAVEAASGGPDEVVNVTVPTYQPGPPTPAGRRNVSLSDGPAKRYQLESVR
jgi:hypothetical protein